MAYNVSNPHPEFGKNKNIANELGHTVYPKMVYKEKGGKPIVVNNEKEEKEALADKVETTGKPAWGK